MTFAPIGRTEFAGMDLKAHVPPPLHDNAVEVFQILHGGLCDGAITAGKGEDENRIPGERRDGDIKLPPGRGGLGEDHSVVMDRQPFVRQARGGHAQLNHRGCLRPCISGYDTVQPRKRCGRRGFRQGLGRGCGDDLRFSGGGGDDRVELGRGEGDPLYLQQGVAGIGEFGGGGYLRLLSGAIEPVSRGRALHREADTGRNDQGTDGGQNFLLIWHGANSLSTKVLTIGYRRR